MPFLSWRGAQIGGLWVFSWNQNNRGSSGAYVTCYCGLSVKINTRKTPHGARRSWAHLFWVCLHCMCCRQIPKDPQFEPHGWWRHYTGWYRRSGISRVLALVRAGFGLFHLLLYFKELVLKYHDQDPYNNQLAAVQSQNKQACINMIKPGSVVYWEVTLFLNYIVRSDHHCHWCY